LRSSYKQQLIRKSFLPFATKSLRSIVQVEARPFSNVSPRNWGVPVTPTWCQQSDDSQVSRFKHFDFFTLKTPPPLFGGGTLFVPPPSLKTSH
jgi:hypothetical protein